MEQHTTVGPQLLDELQQTLNSFNHLFNQFNQEQANVVPFANSWTPAQVAEHVHKSVSGFNEMLNGSTAETERDPAQMANGIKNMFLDFDTKMQSPDFVVPDDKHYDKQDLLNTLQKDSSAIVQSAENSDLNKTLTGFEIPQAGYLTGIEAVTFVTYHTQRHIHQLKNMGKVILDEGAAKL